MKNWHRIFVAFAIVFLLAVPIGLSNANYLGSLSPVQGSGKTARILSKASSVPYAESLALYITSSEALWSVNLTRVNINLNVSVSFTVTLTSYSTWSSEFEVFGLHGFNLLGSAPPMPNATLLTVFTSSSSTASQTATTLGNEFAEAFQPYTSNSTSFTFISPMDFTTEMHIFFWGLLPSSSGGYANMTTETNFESNDLEFFQVSNVGGSYSILYGALSPTVTSSSVFSLYSQLGVSALNYSSSAASSDISIHVLGGLASNVNSTFIFHNYPNNFSSTYYWTRNPSNVTVPNINSTLDFSFPTIIAYRQISNLNPSPGSNVTVTVTVDNVSPSGTGTANVTFDDNWFSSYSGFNKTGGTNSANFTSVSGNSTTFAYFVKVPNSTGLFTVPRIPVEYNFTAAGYNVSSVTYLNTETMVVGSTGSLASAATLESYQNTNVSSITAGSPLSLTIFVKNFGPFTAANVKVAGNVISTLGVGQTQNFTITASASSLTQINATIVNSITWTASYGPTNETTNTVSALYSFSNPSSPATTISKSISFTTNNDYANVTILITNGGSNSLMNLNVSDPLPNNVTYVNLIGNLSSSISNSSLSNATLINAHHAITFSITNMTSGNSVTFVYNVSMKDIDENYVFLPASVSVSWNNVTITHYSQGFGAPLGVTASKSITPDAGFQGSSVTEFLGIQNHGSLPIFDISLANSTDSFLSTINSSTSFESILTQGQQVSSTLDANITGSPGTYNSSAAAVSFVFAGSNQTASSSVFSITIYQGIFSTLRAVGPKIEELHNINVSLSITNPSNVSVSNVNYNVSLPSNLKLVSGNLVVNIASLGPNKTVTSSFVVYTSIPFVYKIPGGNLTFQYQNRTLIGITSPLSLNIADDLTIRYGIPVIVGLLLVVGTLYYVRRLSKKP